VGVQLLIWLFWFWIVGTNSSHQHNGKPDVHGVLAAGKLQATDLKATSRAMQAHNAEMKDELQEKWQDNFRRIFDGQPPAMQQPRVRHLAFDAALRSAYGVSLLGCQGHKEVSQS
jgi:hypothetical protein